MQPIDYTLEQRPVLPSPVILGIQDAFALDEMRHVRQTRIDTAEAKRRQEAAAAARSAELAAELDRLDDDPSPRALARLVLRFPDMVEPVRRVHEMLEPEQRRAMLQHSSQVYAALRSNQPAVAQRLLSRQIEAYRNAGDEDEARALEQLSENIESDPTLATEIVGLQLAATDPKFIESMERIEEGRRRAAEARRQAELHPTQRARLEAEAAGAGAQARIAATEAEHRGEALRTDIAHTRAQIARDQAETARAHADAARVRAAATAERQTQAAAEAYVPPAVPPLDPIRNPAAAFGTRAVIARGINTVAEAVGGRLPFEHTEEALQAIENLRVQTITMAQDAIPGRPSNYLMQQLDRLAVQPGSILMGQDRARIRLVQTRNMLLQEANRVEREILRNPDKHSASELARSRNSFGMLQQLVQQYDQVIRAFGEGTARAPARTPARTPAAPAGAAPLPPGFVVDR